MQRAIISRILTLMLLEEVMQIACWARGVNLALISKALEHSSLAVTTQYLDIDVEEVIDNLREFFFY